ncbi:glycoside hydrolase family 65 protein [Patulibacter minatonensis]|uniref:glycoside hydrolase family 65 protein n=1 Tax=Patulibacter minatonensis TaxID=298163 RepID=UPI00047905AE|nr:glycosyl hydrolase family 65 protein [Patulibacter minatonensis]
MTDHQHSLLEPWGIQEHGLDLDRLPAMESIFALSNGHLGLRGNLDEGEPRGQSGTYLGGFHELYPLSYGERGFGFAEDGQSIINVTDGKLIRLLVEDEPFDVHRGWLQQHDRFLDFRTGILERNVTWRSQAGRSVRVKSRRLVSFTQRSVAAIEYEVEAVDEDVRIALQSNLLANQVQEAETMDPRKAAALGTVLESELHTGHDLRVVLGHRTRRSGLALAAGMDHVIDRTYGTPKTLLQIDEDLGRVTISALLKPGEPLRIVKFLAYHWSGRQSMDWLRDQVDASLENAIGAGFAGLAAAQRDYLDRYWRVADFQIDGDPELQQAIRFAKYQLLQASARAETRAVGAKGLTGTGYDGHAFWDTESFMLPPLTYTKPALVRDQLMWRAATLRQARDRAAQLGLRGAAFPWRTIHGEECSGYWPAGIAAFHVNASIAHAVQRYVFATGDVAFERAHGLELLVETARLWSSLGHHGTDGEFRIDGVTGPDEYTAIVNNNVYTNLMAQLNLTAAADAAEAHLDVSHSLGVNPEEVASWRVAAAMMHVPFDERLGIHPQDQDFLLQERWDFEGTDQERYPLLLHFPYFQLYRKQVVKQPDLVMALFVRGDVFTAEEKEQNFAYYEGLTVRDSSLSAGVQSIVAAEVGHVDLAYDYLAEGAFTDLHDLKGDAAEGLHIASLGGVLGAVMFGLGGFRDIGGRLAFRPRIPDGLTRVAFPVIFRGQRIRVVIEPGRATYSLTSVEDGGDESGLTPVTIVHEDEELELVAGVPVVRPLVHLDPPILPVQPAGRTPHRRSHRQPL